MIMAAPTSGFAQRASLREGVGEGDGQPIGDAEATARDATNATSRECSCVRRRVYPRLLAGCAPVSRLIVIEGLDGAGKRTLADRLIAALAASRAPSGGGPSRATTPTSTPSWSATRCTGGSGDLGDSVHGMALLFALDRRDAGAAVRRAGGARRCWWTGTWRRTPPTARPGWLRRTRPGSSWPGSGRWRSTGSPSRSPTTSCCSPCRDGGARRAARPRAHRAGPGARLVRVRRRACSGARSGATAAWRAAWLSPWTLLDGVRRDADALAARRRAAARRCHRGRRWSRPANGMLSSMKSRVLVVDDDPALAEMLTIVLRGEGFDTAVVADGTRALPAAPRAAPGRGAARPDAARHERHRRVPAIRPSPACRS